MKKNDIIPDNEHLKQTIESDVLGRNGKLLNLVKLLNSITENYIISIDGDWGCGKTFFVEQLMYLHSNYESVSGVLDKGPLMEFKNKYQIVYYNAWANDDHENILESLIYNILNEFPKFEENPIKSVKFDLFKKMLGNFIEISSFGVLKKEDIESLKTYDDLASKITTIEEKKKALNKLIDEIVHNDKRLLLIIDEIDRCNPSFAVKTIEIIKHFYNNDKITIIMSTNNKQLSHTICHYYGEKFDGYGYLNKIYDTIISLTNDNIEEYAKYYFDFNNSTNLPENVCSYLFTYYKFTYREVNRFMSMYNIVKKYFNYKDSFNKSMSIQADIFFPIALILKIKDIKLFNDYIYGNGEYIIKEIFSNIFLENNKYLDIKWLKQIFYSSEENSLIDSILNEYRKIFNDNCFGRFPFLEAVSMLGNKIVYDD